MRVISLGHAMFALMMIAVGIMGFAMSDFAPIWQPVPKAEPAREMLIYLTAIVSLASGAGLLWTAFGRVAAPVLFVSLLGWMLAFKVPFIVRAPAEAVSYETTGETAVLVAATWILWVWVAGDWEKRWLGFVAGETGAHIARIVYGLALIAFGIAHFAYLKLTASLVPNWLPSHEAWATFTGFTYVTAGAAIISGVLARLAAALAALQIALLTLLVWVPAMFAAHVDPSTWTEFVVSSAMTAAALVVAESYSGMPWLSMRKR